MKKVFCSECKFEAPILFYMTMNRKICRECYSFEMACRAEAVEAVAEVKDLPAPLGYSFVGSKWFDEDLKGESYARFLMACNWGVLN